jgi:hypothetical protein
LFEKKKELDSLLSAGTSTPYQRLRLTTTTRAGPTDTTRSNPIEASSDRPRMDLDQILAAAHDRVLLTDIRRYAADHELSLLHATRALILRGLADVAVKRKGGLAMNRTITRAQRSANAKRAAEARWRP